MRNVLQITFGIVFAFTAVGCSSSSDTDNVTVPALKNRVKWTSIPAEYNPQISELTLNTVNVETIRMNIMGFAADVEAVYSDKVTAGQAILRTYKVSKNAATWAAINSSLNNKVLNVGSYGDYACKIRTENGKITELDGGCYVRLQIVLPLNAEIEVYNLNQLISTYTRLKSVSELIQSLKETTWVGDKRFLLNDFLESYQKAGKKPSFSADEVGMVVHQFDLTKDKLNILRRLKDFIADPQNLRAMIDREYPEHARGEARIIAGV